MSWKAILKAEKYSTRKEENLQSEAVEMWTCLRCQNSVCCTSTSIWSSWWSWSSILMLMWKQVWILRTLRDYKSPLKWEEVFFLACKLAYNEWHLAVHGVDHRLTLPITRRQRFCNRRSENGPGVTLTYVKFNIDPKAVQRRHYIKDHYN